MLKTIALVIAGILIFAATKPGTFRVERAVAAGAKITMRVAGMFRGDRYGKLEDPFGHRGSVATYIRDVSPEEIKQAMQKMGG